MSECMCVSMSVYVCICALLCIQWGKCFYCWVFRGRGVWVASVSVDNHSGSCHTCNEARTTDTDTPSRGVSAVRPCSDRTNNGEPRHAGCAILYSAWFSSLFVTLNREKQQLTSKSLFWILKKLLFNTLVASNCFKIFFFIFVTNLHLFFILSFVESFVRFVCFFGT